MWNLTHRPREARARRTSTDGASSSLSALVPLIALSALFTVGCTAAHYRKQADRDVYSLLRNKEQNLFGRTNAFTIDTPYSPRDPNAIKAEEIIQDRFRTNKLFITLPDALRIAITNSRTYQLHKETLYLTGLTLTLDRHTFEKRLSGTVGGTVGRNSSAQGFTTENDQWTVSQLLRSGGTVTASLLNDFTRYFIGSPGATATSVMSLNLSQPLLRGFGADIAAESLTQSERDVIYEIRNFALFQQTFASDVVTAYFRQLQRKDAVINGYENYLKLVKGREQAEALSRGERLAAFQVDQSRQEELKAKAAYISAVQAYQDGLDSFKQTLGLPVGYDLALDDGALKELSSAALLPVDIGEEQGYELAASHRLDLLNEIDRFEDAKRKVHVSRDRLRPGLLFTANAALNNDGVNYAKFVWNKSTASAGLQLDLPFDRVSERNIYRTSLISFERELRALGIALDTMRESVRSGLRSLDAVMQNYEIQKSALKLADIRVDSANLLLQAGRAQIRDQLEAQTAQVQAQNAVTQALVDYLAARLKLLIDLGALDVDQEKFWLKPAKLPGVQPRTKPATPPQDQEVLPPEKIFAKP